MTPIASSDLDYLTARLHARRSRMAEAERLDALCRTRTIPEVGQALHAGASLQTAGEFQRLALQELIDEYSFCRRHLSGAVGELVCWLQSRFQLENIKVLLRGFVNRISHDVLQKHLVSLPRELQLDTEVLLQARDEDEFVSRLPAGPSRKRIQAWLRFYPEERSLFLLEAALDAGYFAELLARASRLSGEEMDFIAPLMRQEAGAFLLMLAVRGKFHHGCTTETLLPLQIPQSGISHERLRGFLTAMDIATAAGFALGRVVDEIPAQADAADLEVLTWKRFQRLANRAFRRSHLGLGAVIGYLELRRIELANLITLSEGVRLAALPEAIRARLIPRAKPEPVYV